MDANKEWAEKIRRAKKVREDWANRFNTQMGRDYFEGVQNPGYPEEEWITVNKIYSHMQAQLPILYSVDPYYYVKLSKSYQIDPAKIAEMEQKGNIRQAMLNYLKRELKLKEKARMSISDAHFEYGVAKVRRASSSEKHPHAGQPVLADDGKTPLNDESGKPMVYPDTIPVNERYELHRIHPNDFLFDEDAGPLEESWKWLAQKIRMSKAAALDDERFDQKAVRSAQGKARANDKDGKSGGILDKVVELFRRKDEEIFLDTWEIFDLENHEFLVYCEDANDLFIEPQPCPPGIDKHPFSILRFTLRDDSPYPIPPVSPALGPQKELCMSRSRLLTHRKRFNRKYEVNVNFLAGDQKEQLSKLENGDDGTIVEVNQGGGIQPINDAPLDQQNLMELNLLNNDITEAFGTPGSSRGVADADSATEASILDQRLEVREGDRISLVADFAIDIARKLDMLVQAHIDRDEAVKITGPQGEFWQTVKKTDYQEIAGEYEYSVNLGSSQARIPEVERAQLIAFVSQVIVPFPHILKAPALLKHFAQLYRIEDESTLEDLKNLGQLIFSGAMPMPGGQGGGPSNNPVADVIGKAMGGMGGNANGGGAATLHQ
jgi:hypothetical protein